MDMLRQDHGEVRFSSMMEKPYVTVFFYGLLFY